MLSIVTPKLQVPSKVSYLLHQPYSLFPNFHEDEKIELRDQAMSTAGTFFWDCRQKCFPLLLSRDDEASFSQEWSWAMRGFGYYSFLFFDIMASAFGEEAFTHYLPLVVSFMLTSCKQLESRLSSFKCTCCRRCCRCWRMYWSRCNNGGKHWHPQGEGDKFSGRLPFLHDICPLDSCSPPLRHLLSYISFESNICFRPNFSMCKFRRDNK